MPDSTDSSDADLLYPFYLDLDMTMAYAAALTGGVALEVEDLAEAADEHSKVRELKAGLRLFDIFDFGGRRNASKKESVKSRSRMIRHHTEASIFITLFSELTKRGKIVAPSLETLHIGEITSLEVGPATAPLLRVVNQILRLLDLMSPELAPTPPTPPRKGSGNQGRTTQPKPPPATTSPSSSVDTSITETRQLFRSLKGDLEFSGMTDIVVRRDEGLSVLLTLDNRFITDQTLEMLHTSTYRVIGKVTQIWKSDSDIVQLYRRSVLNLVPALPSAMGWLVLGMLGQIQRSIDIAGLQRSVNEALGVTEYEAIDPDDIRIGDDFQAMFPAMNGPAIQILPLAICA